MQKNDKKILEEIIRVDHAGERGAIKIYEGQLLALKTIKQDETLKLTSLQLILYLFSCSRSCSFDKVPVSPALHTNDSLKKPCSIPK